MAHLNPITDSSLTTQPPPPAQDDLAPARTPTLETLEPYEPQRTPWKTKGKRQNRRNKLLEHEITSTLFSPKIEKYKKFFIIKATDGTNLSEIDTITANEQLERTLHGPPQNITETRSGILKVEVKNRAQSAALSNLKRLDNISVEVQPDNQRNQTKATITYYNGPNHSADRLLQQLKRYNVTEVYQMKKKIRGALVGIPTYILTFDTIGFPEEVKIGWTKCATKLYIPRPRRCFKCQGFAHGANNCRETIAICQNCGEEVHGSPCNRPPKCCNCKQPHSAASRDCYTYIFEEEVLSTQVRERLTYPEAKRIVSSRFIKPTRSFARVVKDGNPAQSTPAPSEQNRDSTDRTDANPSASPAPSAAPVPGSNREGAPNRGNFQPPSTSLANQPTILPTDNKDHMESTESPIAAFKTPIRSIPFVQTTDDEMTDVTEEETSNVFSTEIARPSAKRPTRQPSVSKGHASQGHNSPSKEETSKKDLSKDRKRTDQSRSPSLDRERKKAKSKYTKATPTSHSTDGIQAFDPSMPPPPIPSPFLHAKHQYAGGTSTPATSPTTRNNQMPIPTLINTSQVPHPSGTKHKH